MGTGEELNFVFIYFLTKLSLGKFELLVRVQSGGAAVILVIGNRVIEYINLALQSTSGHVYIH